MYFDNFPKLLYDFQLEEGPTFSVDGPKYQLVTDISRNVRFRKEFMDQIQFYEVYRMQDGETIEKVSEKIYGTPDYHWALMLLNQKYDYLEDFAVPSYVLDDIIEKKYGDRKNDPHHFVNDAGDNVFPTFILTLTDPIIDPILNTNRLFQELKVGYVIRRKTILGEYIARIDAIDTVKKQVSAYTSFGGFSVGDTVQVYKYYDNAQGVYTEQLLQTPSVTAVEFPANVTEVTNAEHEYIENEKRRMLRIIPQQYMDQIISEFDRIMTQTNG